MYRVNFGNSMGAFGIPNEVVDDYLQLSGALSLKVLLVLYRNARPMSAAQLAEVLSQNEGDVRDALNYWISCNIIAKTDQNEHAFQPQMAVQKQTQVFAAEPQPQVFEPEPAVVTQLPLAEPEDEVVEAEAEHVGAEDQPEKEKEPEKPKDEVKTTVKVERFKTMTHADVNELAQMDNMVEVIVQEAQNILGRILVSKESEMLVSIYHYYGMDIDILLMLLTYCKSIGQDSAGQIERLAINWLNREIDTHEKAEEELLRLTREDKDEQVIRSIFGVYNRKISKREKDYFSCWTQEFGFNEEMIKLAYERTIDSKGQLNFSYTNGILSSWYEKGIASPQQANNETNPNKKTTNNSSRTNNNASNDNNASYDLDKLNDMINHGSVWD